MIKLFKISRDDTINLKYMNNKNKYKIVNDKF